MPMSLLAAAAFDPPAWTAAPFVLLLLTIAVLPLAAPHFWHRPRNQVLVAALFALPVAGYLVIRNDATGGQSVAALKHELAEYGSFIVLLGALYVVAGGLVVRGDIRGRPLSNTAFLAGGAVLANLIGTTGASMVLIRPVLRINQERERTAHIPVFFIFLVSNLGGLLTPLGDPPLFLGFLEGVPFAWTARLWPEWVVANGLVLGIFLSWDAVAYGRESDMAKARDDTAIEPLRLVGKVNVLLLAGILLAVLLQSEAVGQRAGAWVRQFAPAAPADWTLRKPAGEAVMAALGLLSLLLTPRGLRAENQFTWRPILEVAILFAGIFVTMVPALALLGVHGSAFGLTEPWQFFWVTGGLSSVLDNAPTYVSLGTMAAGEHDFQWLADNRPAILEAISCGAVFMGATTYVGNGPNFMVKAIAERAGFRMPSFFGYLAYSGLILLPVFGVVTFLFFRP
jgi:Na+/H+ antiporter NhaD/arsenite permease-like protein